MSPELEKIVKMLEGGGAELQCAAAMVLGELESKDEKVHQALLGALKSENEEVRLYAVEALARTRAREAAPHFIPFLAGSPRLRGRVQQILAELGDDIIPLLQKRIDKASPELRRGLLEVLGQFRQVDLSETLFEALLDKDPEVVRQAAGSLRERFAGLKEDERDAAAKKMTAFLAQPKARKKPESVVAALQILQDLRSPSSVRTYLDFTGTDHPGPVRAAALTALAATGTGGEEERVVAKILPLLAEADQADVVSPALQVLSKAKVGKEHAERIRKLQKSPHPAVRLFAIGALGGLGASKAADGLIEGLWNSDARVAEEAATALRSNAAFAKPLVRALEAEEDAGRAWKLANVLRVHREAIDESTVASFLRRCLALHEKRGPAFQVYFEILRSVAPGDLRDAILKRSRELMSRKRVEDADRMLRLLEREDLATGASDYLLAISQLRTLNKDIALAPRDRSKSVLLFSKLIRRGEVPVVKNLEKDAKLLTPLDLLYLGFVLIEREGADREFGAAVLRLLVKKYGSSKEAKTAKAKLKTQGTV
jgi:HEAT repeat protein